MTWRKRIGLALGLLSVVVLAAGLTMIVNSNSGKVAGKSASLMAEDYPVGTDYSGTITEQYVKVGDEVAAGQPLFEVQSATLERDLAQGLVNKDNLTYEVKNDNTLVITATNAGQVQDIAYADGAFVPANSTIATVQEAGTMYVAADFLLSAKDYARIPAQAELQIVLPNNQKITAAVSEIKVSTENGEARTIIKAYSDELANGTGLFAVGTPVESTLILTNDGIVTDVTNTVTGWFGVQA
jgi:multidrug efflux pump subunit AcrA (membrane-fusion protein)